MAKTKDPTIPANTLVKVEVPTIGGLTIETLSAEGRQYTRKKTSRRSGQFLFGTVLSGPYVDEGRVPFYRVQWTGRRYRTSFVPTTRLQRAKTRN